MMIPIAPAATEGVAACVTSVPACPGKQCHDALPSAQVFDQQRIIHTALRAFGLGRCDPITAIHYAVHAITLQIKFPPEVFFNTTNLTISVLNSTIAKNRSTFVL
jgi:hypothetical protein